MKLHRYARILRLIDVIGDCLDVKVPDGGTRRPVTSPRNCNIFRHEYRTHILLACRWSFVGVCVSTMNLVKMEIYGTDLRIRVTEDKLKSREKRARETG